MLLKYAVEECLKVGKSRAFIASVRGFPLHIAVERCGDRADSCVRHVANHEHLAGRKELRDDAHIVLQLLVGLLRIGDFARRGFQFNHGDRQAVDEQAKVERELRSVDGIAKLSCHTEDVLLEHLF